jgi:hypothetical protein
MYLLDDFSRINYRHLMDRHLMDRHPYSSQVYGDVMQKCLPPKNSHHRMLLH